MSQFHVAMKGSFVLIICLITSITIIRAHQELQKGPYKTTLTSIKHCPKTTLPLLTRNPGYTANLKFVNTTKTTNLLVGKITFTRSLQNLSMIAIAHKWEKGKWKTHLTLPRLTCKSPVCVTVLAMMTNVKFDPGACVVIKGTYQIEFDINMADHLWAPEREYGRIRWKFEFINKRNTLACYFVENVVEPIKKVENTKDN